MTRCHGGDCPLRKDCYRFTKPVHTREMFGSNPFDEKTGTCQYFETNTPTEEFIRDSAYFLWLSMGKPTGCEDEIWTKAKTNAYASYGREML